MSKPVKIAVMLAAAAVSAGLLFCFDPATSGFYPRCLLHEYTGWYCPMCGTTRALHQLLHGHWGTALHCNALAILLLPLLVYYAARGQGGRLQPIWICLLVGIVIFFGVARNIPAYPFNLLAP